MRFISMNVLWKRIKALKFMMMDKNVALWKKALVVFGIIYLCMPIDLIPIVVFPIGIIDDLILWLWILIMLKDTLDTYWLGEKNEDLSENYDGKTIINDVEYEVNTEKNPDVDTKKETNEDE